MLAAEHNITKKFRGGLKLSSHKQLTQKKPSHIASLPERLVLPLKTQNGVELTVRHSVGSQVFKGQLIADTEHPFGTPLHATTSGKITAITDHIAADPRGEKTPCIVIQPDGDDRWATVDVPGDYTRYDTDALQMIIRHCGVVGLGGAGFPAHVKLREGTENAVDTLIINAVECDPFITCDECLIREKATYAVTGTRMIARAIGAKRSVIAVNEDLHEVIRLLGLLVKDGIELVRIPNIYPAGSERQLIQQVTDRVVPSNGLPIHIGVVIHNVATAAAVYRAITRGEPVISRYVTVTGMLPDPKNLQVLIGTPVSHCLKLCGLDNTHDVVVILGGMMNGFVIHDMSLPITKTTAAIIVLDKMADHQYMEQPCIRCGRCMEICPIELMPQQLYLSAKANAHKEAHALHLFNCIECGCCDYVCPSHIPLVSLFRQEKDSLRYLEKKKQQYAARENRYLEKQRRDEQGNNDIAALFRNKSETERKAFIKEAVARSHDKKFPRDSRNT